MKIEIKKGFAGCVFGEIHSRLFEVGDICETSIDIDEELLSVALREGWVVEIIEVEEKLFPVEENKLMTEQENKVVKKRSRVKKG